jgi:hypothetical protein
MNSINTRARGLFRAGSAFAKDCGWTRLVAAAASSSMVSPCFHLNETRELTLRIEEEGRSASKTSHAGIIRIGF